MADGAVVAVAIGDEAVGAGLFQQHEGEVLGAHGWLLGQHVGLAHHLGHDAARELGLGGGVDGGRVVAHELELAARVMRRADALGQGLHAPLDQVQHLQREGAHRALQLHAVGHHVRGLARMDHGDRDHARLDGLDVAADDGLQAQDQLGRHGQRVDHHVRHGRMAALAAHDDAELVARRHGRARSHGHGARAHAGPVVHAEHGLHGELGEQAVLDHLARAAAALFGRLEDQVHRALETVAVRGQVLRGGQQHGDVAVMSAGMHFSGMAAGMLEGVELLHGQGVHVGAQADGPAAGAAVTAVDGAHHARAAQAAVHGNAPSLQLPGHEVGGADLLEAQFGVGMYVAAQRGDLGRAVQQFLQQGHGVLL